LKPAAVEKSVAETGRLLSEPTERGGNARSIAKEKVTSRFEDRQEADGLRLFSASKK